MKPILEALKWRYATEIFKSEPLSEESLSILLDAARLAPSSMNFQPWKWIIVKDINLREQIYEAGFKQEKIKAAPHLLVLAARTEITQADVDAVINITKSTRGVSEEDLRGYRSMLEKFIQGKSPEELGNWAKKQVYIALGFFLETAALLEVDAAPMEGFLPSKADQILSLEDTGYTSVVLVALGHRSPEDIRSTWTKVRFPKTSIIDIR